MFPFNAWMLKYIQNALCIECMMRVQSNLVYVKLDNVKNLDYVNFFLWRDLLFSGKPGFLQLFSEVKPGLCKDFEFGSLFFALISCQKWENFRLIWFLKEKVTFPSHIKYSFQIFSNTNTFYINFEYLIKQLI